MNRARGVRHRLAQDLGPRHGATVCGRFARLQDHEGGPFSRDEAAAPPAERPRKIIRVPSKQEMQPIPGRLELRHALVRTPRQDDVADTVSHQARGRRDSRQARCLHLADGEAGAAQAQDERALARRSVRDGDREEQRGDACRPFLEQRGQERGQRRDTGGHRAGHQPHRSTRTRAEPGPFQRLERRGRGQTRAAIQPAPDVGMERTRSRRLPHARGADPPGPLERGPPRHDPLDQGVDP